MRSRDGRATAAPGSGTPVGGLYAISDGEFEQFRALVDSHTGIALGPQKRHLLASRLGRRLRALGLSSFSEYYRVLTEGDPEGAELACFVNAMTTNKTDFFREAYHFRYLAETWLPARRERAARGGERRLRIWSAACSTGEEPYTIAMTVREALGSGDGWDIRILASDIDTEALERAAAGVYSREQVAPVPGPLLARHFLRGAGARTGLLRVRPELRSLVTFRRINFVEEPWRIRARFDAIFCRNALIYFNRDVQQRILRRLTEFLAADGLLFLGHSETLHGLLSGFEHLGTTIYRRAASGAPAEGTGTPCRPRSSS